MADNEQLEDEVVENDDFDDAFDDEVAKETVEDDSEDDLEDESDDETEKKDVKPEEDKSKTEEVEEDEATKRGKEALRQKEEQETRAAEEAKKAQEAEEARKVKEEASRITPYTKENIQSYSRLINLDELPDTFEVDGVEYNLKEQIEDFPALVPLMAIGTQKVLKNLVTNGYLTTSNALDKVTSDFKNQLSQLTFDIGVYKSLPGVDVDAILESKEFVEYFKSVPEEKKALLTTGNPKDCALLIKDYQKSVEGIKAAESAKQKASELDKKARAKKDVEDALHSDTSKTRKSSVSADIEVAEDDFDAAFDASFEA